MSVKTESDVVKIERLGLREAADRKGVSRQAIWQAAQEGRVNSVQVDGVWLIYADEKFAGLNWKKRRTDCGKTRRGEKTT